MGGDGQFQLAHGVIEYSEPDQHVAPYLLASEGFFRMRIARAGEHERGQAVRYVLRQRNPAKANGRPVAVPAAGVRAALPGLLPKESARVSRVLAESVGKACQKSKVKRQKGKSTA